MKSIDINLKKEELEYIVQCISVNLNFYSEVPEIALLLIELIKYKLNELNNPEK